MNTKKTLKSILKTALFTLLVMAVFVVAIDYFFVHETLSGSPEHKRIFTNGQDRYPFVREDGWDMPIYNVAVILAEPSDVRHISTPILDSQPCKLIPEKTYDGHNKEYYQDLAYCVSDYHRENSFGTVNLDFEIFDNGGEWFKTTGSESSYVGNERQFVIDAVTEATDSGVDLSKKNIVIVLHAGFSAQATGNDLLLSTHTWPPTIQPLGYPPLKIIAAENDLMGFWAHEIGHLIGVLITPGETGIPDLYQIGLSGMVKITETGETIYNTKAGRWDVMAYGFQNGEYNNPPYMSSFTKEFLKWLRYDIHPRSAYGEYWINSLETSEFGNTVFRYNLSDDTNDNSQKYYILEVRNRNLKTWDSSLPEDMALVLYRVDTKDFLKYGYDSNGKLNILNWKINIPFFGGVLDPDGDSHLYADLEGLIYFTALEDERTDDNYRIRAEIEKVDHTFFTSRFHGIIMDPTSQFHQRIVPYFSFNSEFGWKITGGSMCGSDYEWRRFGYVYRLTCANERIEASKALGNILISIIALNILLVLSKILIIPKWKSEKKKKKAKTIIKTIHTISSIIFVFLLYMSMFEMRTVKDVFKYVIGVPGTKESAIASIKSLPEGDTLDFLFYSSILLIPVSFVLFLIDKIIISRLRIGKIKRAIKYIFKKVWKTTLIIFILFIICLILTGAPTGKGAIEFNIATLQTNLSISPNSALPDLDLHLYCDDGRHIGINYETGEYEIDIEDAIVSGDNSNSPEWIFISPNRTDCHYYVSSQDNQTFLEENPQIAAEMEDTTDAYEIYARYIDPETDIYTSAIITEEGMEPGTELEHKITGADDINIEPGILITNSSPFDIKEKTVEKLEEAKTGNNKVDRKINRIIKDINKSLQNNLWQDEAYLDPKKGRKVFGYEMAAATKMKLYLYLSNLSSYHELPENVIVAFEQTIEDLVTADKILAQAILNEASNTSVKNPKYQNRFDRMIVKAEQNLEQANQYSADKPARAVLKYGFSWYYSQKAIQYANKN